MWSGDADVRALLLDIEGTTTPVNFVYQTLFPYARAYVREFLTTHARDADVRRDVERLRAEHEEDMGRGSEPPLWSAESQADETHSVVVYLHWLMDRDRKSTPLKSLQGKIWEEAYRTGALRGDVYPDVPRALTRWRGQGRSIAIFSSGSVLAQKLLFGNSNAGDLTGFISAYFDTAIGSKREPESYRRIAGELALEPAAILFVSDVVEELDAAQKAGMQVVLCVREGEAPAACPYAATRSFDELLP